MADGSEERSAIRFCSWVTVEREIDVDVEEDGFEGLRESNFCIGGVLSSDSDSSVHSLISGLTDEKKTKVTVLSIYFIKNILSSGRNSSVLAQKSEIL